MKLTRIVVLAFGLGLAGIADANISDSIRNTLTSNQNAASFVQWKEAGFTPEDIFHNALLLPNAKAWAELCKELSSLDDESLALFEQEISHEQHAQRLKCRARLLERLGDYWSMHRFALDAGYGFDAEPSLPQLSSEQRAIDAKSGPILVTGDLKPGEIALTFDDGPHPTRTDRVLQILKASGVRATFFQVGEMAQHYPLISREVLNQGHTVGSHSFNHSNLPKLAQKSAEKNIVAGMDAVTAATGIETPFFRFPYGARTRTLEKFVHDFGLASFLWNIDSSDWKMRDPIKLLANVIRGLDHEKGGIILFHDIHEQTVIVLPHVLEALKARNFKTVVYVPQAN